MTVDSVKSVKFYPNQINFRNEPKVYAPQSGHDEFINSKKSYSNNKSLWIIGGIILAGLSAFLTHKADWWGKEAVNKLNNTEFKTVNEAKEYFESLGIEIDFRGANDEHLPMLKRIKENMKQLKEMGVKKDKPDSLTISDWDNKTELEEIHRAKGVFLKNINQII